MHDVRKTQSLVHDQTNTAITATEFNHKQISSQFTAEREQRASITS